MFFGRPKKRSLRVFFATDIHGSDRCFRKFLAAADSYEADVLVLGGDIAGKGLVPIRRENGNLVARVRGEPVAVPRAEEERLRAEINRMGFYSVLSDAEDIERMERDQAHLDRAFQRAIIEKIVEGAPVGRKMVVNFHCPPYGSGLDFAAELDPQLRPVIRGGRPSIVPVGSKAVREVIKRHQPAVGLHGHIHESKAAQKIGSTMCLNPGSDYAADVLRGAIVDFAEDGSYINFLFTTG